MTTNIISISLLSKKYPTIICDLESIKWISYDDTIENSGRILFTFSDEVFHFSNRELKQLQGRLIQLSSR